MGKETVAAGKFAKTAYRLTLAHWIGAMELLATFVTRPEISPII
jgi:hypothetical protein